MTLNTGISYEQELCKPVHDGLFIVMSNELEGETSQKLPRTISPFCLTMFFNILSFLDNSACLPATFFCLGLPHADLVELHQAQLLFLFSPKSLLISR